MLATFQLLTFGALAMIGHAPAHMEAGVAVFRGGGVGATYVRHASAPDGAVTLWRGAHKAEAGDAFMSVRHGDGAKLYTIERAGAGYRVRIAHGLRWMER